MEVTPPQKRQMIQCNILIDVIEMISRQMVEVSSACRERTGDEEHLEKHGGVAPELSQPHLNKS